MTSEASVADHNEAVLHVVRRDGRAPRTIIVHGAMDRSVSFGRMARRFTDRELITYDRRGYGRSIGLGTGDLDRHVADLVELVGDEPTVLVGHSAGGVISLAAALREPLVLGVIAYEPPMMWSDWWPRAEPSPHGDPSTGDPEAQAEEFMVSMVGERIWRRLGEATRNDRRAEGKALRADLALVDPGREPFDPTAVKVPVLCAAGTETTWWHKRGAQELAALLPLGEFVTVEGAGHGVHLSNPAQLAALIEAFIARLGVSAGRSAEENLDRAE